MHDFNALFSAALESSDDFLGTALTYIKQRVGKQMRPKLILLVAKNFGGVGEVTQNSAVGLELLHTASLVHDDVVDESGERRGQASTNAAFGNKVAVLVGDYLLSTALLHVAKTGKRQIVENLSELGRTLASGEILQLANVNNHDFSEDVYYDVIKKKTAALFEACCSIGALSAGADNEAIEAARLFGQNLGIAFQIRDDIFDYYDSNDIGKPTGNDMAEGKLTLPVIYALNATANEEMITLALKVRDNKVSTEEIARLVDFTKKHGGIEYAEQRMYYYRSLCLDFIDKYSRCEEIRAALLAYIDFVIEREK